MTRARIGNAHARRSPTSPTANDESGTDVTVHLPRARRGKATTARLPMRPTKRETGTAPNSATRASRGPCARGRATHAPQGHTGNTQGHTGTHARAGTSDATRAAPSASEGRRQGPARRRDGATAAGAHDAARALRGDGTSGPHAAAPTPRRVASANAPDASDASGNSTHAARRTRASAASGDANAAAARRPHNRDEGRAPPSGRRNQPTPEAAGSRPRAADATPNQARHGHGARRSSREARYRGAD